jgi:hypothetical protein
MEGVPEEFTCPINQDIKGSANTNDRHMSLSLFHVCLFSISSVSMSFCCEQHYNIFLHMAAEAHMAASDKLQEAIGSLALQHAGDGVFCSFGSGMNNAGSK